MIFEKLNGENRAAVQVMSELASSIVKEHYAPILGAAQNDYMIEKFQSPHGIKEQVAHGYQYFFACDDHKQKVGFFAFYPKETALYLSKLYLKKACRGKGYAKEIMAFLIEEAKRLQLSSIELNVNKENFGAIEAYEHLGFIRIRAEKNDIGNGFYMDDYVYSYQV